MKLGFIGCSNLTKAMMRGIVNSGEICAKDIIVTDANKYELINTEKEYNVKTTESKIEVVKSSKLIILAEKSEHYESVAKVIKDYITNEHILISIAPNMTIKAVESLFGENIKIIRAKPNIPAIVGESMTGICCNGLVSYQELGYVSDLMCSFGIVEAVPENLMDVVIAVSSSSPAYVFMFIEAMADAASADGMPRAQAYEFAAQAVLGSAKMILQTGKHPGELKDMVCSPGGTTLEAVRVLEQHGLRSSVFEAVKACAAHCKKM